MTGEVDYFRIRAHVPDFEAIAADYTTRSIATRASLPSQLAVAYGPGADEQLDLFFPTGYPDRRPIHIFVHGGYWRANRKADYAFLADPIVEAGAIAAIVEYTLMPAERMATLVGQVRRAATWLAAHADTFGGDRTALSASGQSAGAHLASYLAARGPDEAAPPKTPVRSLLLVSGIYDLEPIPGSFLQPELGLTADEVATWSPVTAVTTPNIERILAVGADETPPFHAQQAALATSLTAAGAPAEALTLPGLNHMSILTDMGTPGTPLAQLLAKTIAASRR